MTDPSTTTVKSALRVLLLIELLTEHPRGLTFPEIRDALELPKSSLHALLKVTTERGHLVFDEVHRTYRLGVRFLEAGQAFFAGSDLRERAIPVMEHIRDQINETVQLSILDGRENVYVAKVTAVQVLQLVSEVGSRLPAHATGLGKVLLAYLEGEEFDRRFANVQLEQFTPRTVGSVEELRTVLEGIRREGYGVDDGEYTEGVFCVAVPIFGPGSEPLAAMSVSIPSIRLRESTRTEVLELLLRESRLLSQTLGSRR